MIPSEHQIVGVQFSQADWKRADHLGRERQQRDELRRVKERKVAGERGAALHATGVAGEIAFRRYAGLSEDIAIERPDRGHDAVWHGHRFQIKASTLPDPNLLVRYGARDAAEVYVLARVDRHGYSVVDLLGWTTREEFDKYHETRELVEDVPTKFFPASKLRPMGMLSYWLEHGDPGGSSRHAG